MRVNSFTPHPRLRGASIRRRRPRCTLRTMLCYIFPPKHTNKYGVTKNIYIFKILYFENFYSPFLGLWGSCPLFRTSPSLSQDLPYLYLHRHPYATLTKYPRKSRKPKTEYNCLLTTRYIFFFVCTL